MKTKLTLTILFGVLFCVGLGAICWNDYLGAVFTYLSVFTFGGIFIGGVMHYNSRELVDFREVYREKNRLQIEKIRELSKLLGEKTKKNSCY